MDATTTPQVASGEMDASSVAVFPASTRVERPTVRAGVWRRTFLRHLQQHGSPSKASKAAGISISLVYRARDQRPRFKRAWERALRLARRNLIDRAETALADRAIDGWEEPVYQMGREVGSKTRYDHAGLRFLLEAEKPRKYAPRSTASAPTVNVLVNVAAQQAALANPQIAELVCKLDAALASPVALPGPGMADSPASG